MKKIIIVGAGPAGLTAAYELLMRGENLEVLVLEGGDNVGGISRTYRHNGNRIDIGGHRFFSKSDRVMNWWLNILPLDAETAKIYYRGNVREVEKSAPVTNVDDVMLLRPRLSRILYKRQLFGYPITLSLKTLKQLGFFSSLAIVVGYVKARLFPIREEKTLEDFMINRFGVYLYRCFFRDYTEKVWGVPCNEIPASWGKQRIKGVSLKAVVRQAFKKTFAKSDASLAQKDTETSFIERFLYPKYGPGHMWETVAERVKEKGGSILFNTFVTGMEQDTEGNITRVYARHAQTGEKQEFLGDIVISSMPIKTLMDTLSPAAPQEVKKIATNLPYRDFLTVGLLCKKLILGDVSHASQLAEKLPDTWMYIQESDVKVGRLQIFNNWSPALVADPAKIWLGLEYFLSDQDDFWSWSDEKIKDFAISEMEKLNILHKEDVEDSVVIRIEKAYPAYFGSYEQFPALRDYLDTFKNLFFIGRNGQHRYNNQDHSMLTAMLLVDGLLVGDVNKKILWDVNAEEYYHEEKK